MSKPEQMIQSQQVTLTGTVIGLEMALERLNLYAMSAGVTVTLTPTSVPDATVGVTQESQQNPRQWISVDERLPVEDKLVLVCNNFGTRMTAEYSEGNWYTSFGSTNEMNQRRLPKRITPVLITHWMPLPEPPDAQGSVTEQSQQKSRQDGE